MSCVDKWGLIQASPTVMSWGSILLHMQPASVQTIVIIWNKSEKRITINAAPKIPHTKLSIDYGHVWNSLVTIVISLTIKFLGGDINCWRLQSRFSTYLWINLFIGITSIPSLRTPLNPPVNKREEIFCSQIIPHFCHHFSKLLNSNFIVWISHVKNVTISPVRIFLHIKIEAFNYCNENCMENGHRKRRQITHTIINRTASIASLI